MIDSAVWPAVAYGVFLLLVAFALDRLARRAAGRTSAWRSGAFTYHADHDAWICPQDQWLWPHSFDPDNRVMRYRARPAVCNACPVKDACTVSDAGREVTRAVDPWPGSEAERFHRGIACTVALLGALWPLAVALGERAPAERAVLAGAAVLIAAGGLPLWSHLRRTAAAFPADVKVESLDAAVAAEAVAASREARRRTGYRSDRRPGRPAPRHAGGWSAAGGSSAESGAFTDPAEDGRGPGPDGRGPR
ncbi:hypothetical protein GCM10014719_17020 [Planomonospora parontospora subsp. antibiotica]|nr:hypothetical protein GCM10014719_17020 [Planomonospora parontospora subsp. antibiotica]GII15976.1 hypothetical protein Ppa05_27020 [Planomonospora parontospora subsp. antibiotica]